MTSAVWFFAIDRPGVWAEWDWATLGAPVVRDFHSTRRPSSGDFSRHIPVTAYSTTTDSHHELESGLEHDLFRKLDRDPDVVWLLAQPVLLHGLGSKKRLHTPDLLSLHGDGSVTVWDVRPGGGRDEIFERTAAQTRIACEAVGWR